VSFKPEVYCMTVHLFGAKSSPSCANFALLQTDKDNSNEFDRQLDDRDGEKEFLHG